MSQVYTFPTHYEDDTSDSLSSVCTKSSSLDSLETPSPHFVQLSEICDMDTVSSQTKKIRKKRCAYDKIDDEKRIQLLNAVQKSGESLKSAAKRLNINYSSAKSILHTFRKEGRILKKSPLESGARPYSMCNLPSTSMDVSPMNNASRSFSQRFPSQGSISLDTKSFAHCNSTGGPNSPMRGLTSIFANLVIDTDPVDEEPSFVNLILESSKSKEEEPIFIPKLNVPEFTSEISILPSAEETLGNKEVKIPCLSEVTCNLQMLCSQPVSQISHPSEVLKKIDNFYMNYSNSPLSGGRGNMFVGDWSDSGSRKYCPGEFDSFSDMLCAFQVQACHNDDIKGDYQVPTFCRGNSSQFTQEKSELKLIKEDSTDSSSGSGSIGFEGSLSRADSQWLMCESLKKDSFLNTFSQFQKPGISLVNERNN